VSTDSNPSRRLIELPATPKTASPVPELTSIHSEPERGPYGDSRYRGNCGGHLIKDLLRYHQPQRVLDPMTGSGTCRDVCNELGIECVSFDLNAGQDASDPASYEDLGTFDFVWLHPPYWRMIRYGADERCLSQAESLEAFMSRLSRVMMNCQSVLTPSGVIGVLIGGYSERGTYMPLSALTTYAGIQAGLWPSCTEIIRFQHGNTSSRKSYTSSFIPGLHDTCIMFRKQRGHEAGLIPAA